MDVLTIRLCGPMQSWGTRSRFRVRDTEQEPTKSGVIGMIASALGRDRSDSIDDLTSVDMGIRADQEGIVRQEFQTALGVVKAGGSVDDDPQLSYRAYLADADFTVALAGDREVVRLMHDGLLSARRPLFLGRKSFLPSVPLLSGDAILEDSDIETALMTRPLRESTRPRNGAVRLVLPDDGSAGELRQDEPVSFEIETRSYRTRYVRTVFRADTDFPKEEDHVSQQSSA